MIADMFWAWLAHRLRPYLRTLETRELADEFFPNDTYTT